SALVTRAPTTETATSCPARPRDHYGGTRSRFAKGRSTSRFLTGRRSCRHEHDDPSTLASRSAAHPTALVRETPKRRAADPPEDLALGFRRHATPLLYDSGRDRDSAHLLLRALSTPRLRKRAPDHLWHSIRLVRPWDPPNGVTADVRGGASSHDPRLRYPGVPGSARADLGLRRE